MSDTFSAHGIDTRGKTTGQINAICPECSHLHDHNSHCLSVNLDEGLWQCHRGSCGWSGHLATYRDVRRRASQVKVFAKPASAQREALPAAIVSWFAQRGIGPNVLARNRVAYHQGLIEFPFYREGQLINIKHRDPQDKHRQFMVKDAERILYGYDDIDDTALIWVEGEPDKLAVEMAGVLSCASVPDGAPALNSTNYEQKFSFLDRAKNRLDRVQRHILAVDNDGPGQKLEQELARRLGPEKCWRVSWASDCKDANDVLMSYGPEVVKECLDAAAPYPVSGIIEPQTLFDAYIALYDHPELRGKGLTTGWPSLDRYYTIRPGEWTLITGIPSHGKSSWLSALAVHLAINTGWPFAMCVPENQPFEEYLSLLAQLYVGAPFDLGPTLRMSRQEAIQAHTWLQSKVRLIMPPEEGTPTVEYILEKAKIEVARMGVKGLVIDPYSELDHSRPQGMTTTEFVSAFLSKVRRFARQYQVHVWVVAHPTKLVKDQVKQQYPVPTAYDVSDSAHWYNKSDNILSIWRDILSDTHLVELHIQKIRFRRTGQIGKIQLYYHPATGRFSEVGSPTGA